MLGEIVPNLDVLLLDAGPSCHVASGLLTMLPPMVLLHVAAGLWALVCLVQVALLCLCLTRYQCVQQYPKGPN